MITLPSPILAQASTVPLWIIAGYLGLLMALGVLASRFFRGTSQDYFVASRSIGPFLLLMSVFGTTMTGFALVGSSAKSFESGIGVYGLMASWSGLIHSAVFFVVGMRLWALGKKHGYLTQVAFFRDRFKSETLGWLLLPILVLLVIPYLLVGIIASGKFVLATTAGMFPEAFPGQGPLAGGVPPWITGLVVCSVVLCYVFFGGVRSAAWANALQTCVFMLTGVVCFFMIANAEQLGGLAGAGQMLLEHAPQHASRQGMIGYWQFASYLFIPLSVGMFPHLFQHWLTAKRASTFKATLVLHPLFMAIVWVPCILIGVWAAALVGAGELRVPNANAALGSMVGALVESPVLMGLLSAGVLAAIMSSLDSQFVCLGTLFTNDVVLRLVGKRQLNDAQRLWLARGFIVAVVIVAYGLSMALINTNVFDLGVWCFTGFGALFPLVMAALYWRRATAGGAIACVLATAASWGYFFTQDIVLGRHGGEGEYLVMGMMPVAFIFAASALGMVLGSLLSKPMDPAHVERFFPPNPTQAPLYPSPEQPAAPPSTPIQPT